MNNNKRSALKEFAVSLLHKVIKEEGLEGRVDFKVIQKNAISNKVAFVVFDENKAVIVVNLDKLDDSDLKRAEINLYKAIQHEIEHIKMIYHPDDNDIYNYNSLMGLMEYVYYLQFLSCKFTIPPCYMFKYIIHRKQVNYNQDCSTLELNADLLSYLKLKMNFNSDLTHEANEQYDKIIGSLQFLIDSLEIFYDVNEEAVNRFSIFVTSVGGYLKQNPGFLEQHKILRNLFTETLELKSVYDLYHEMNADNQHMYDRLILDYFTTFRADYSKFFEDNGFKQYIEGLFNKYIEQTISYYSNINLGNAFVDDRKVLTVNLRMKKRNVLVLNSIAKAYGLQVSSKNILDSNRIYTYKKE